MPSAIIRRRWPKVSPKKIPETDAIFAQVNAINQAADAADDVLRISMDAKATVKVGPFARGGKSRALVAAADHDFQPAATLTPVGIFLAEVPLFHPRQQQWHEHFQWNEEGSDIIGTTATGRVTVTRLQMNRSIVVQARRLWVQAGWHPPKII